MYILVVSLLQFFNKQLYLLPLATSFRETVPVQPATLFHYWAGKSDCILVAAAFIGIETEIGNRVTNVQQATFHDQLCKKRKCEQLLCIALAFLKFQVKIKH